MSDETKDLIDELENALDNANDAASNASDSVSAIESAINMVSDLQAKLNEPKHCDKCKVLLDLRK